MPPPQKFVLTSVYCGVGIGRDNPTTADGTDERTGVISQVKSFLYL